jgi:hypothetical protein
LICESSGSFVSPCAAIPTIDLASFGLVVFGENPLCFDGHGSYRSQKNGADFVLVVVPDLG